MEPTLRQLDALLDLVLRAGVAIRDVYDEKEGAMAVAWKEDRSPLTAADRISHEIIVAGLPSLAPGTPIVSEEGVDAGERGPLPGEDGFWLVDPLDGTKEFLKRTGEFTVNVALVHGGRPVAGVVHAPALGRSWLGAVDGAEVRVHAGPQSRKPESRHPLRTRPASLEALAIVASRDHAGPEVKALLEGLPGAHAVSMGSSLKFCRIAEGAADFYLRDGPTMEWDTAAAQAVLEAAGGRVMTLDGRTLKYGKPGLRNPHFVAVGDPRLDWRALLEKEESNRKGMGSAQA
jgi:3'(2'), 5'-bisphosphate nucleotidase